MTNSECIDHEDECHLRNLQANLANEDVNNRPGGDLPMDVDDDTLFNDLHEGRAVLASSDAGEINFNDDQDMRLFCPHCNNVFDDSCQLADHIEDIHWKVIAEV